MDTEREDEENDDIMEIDNHLMEAA